MHRRAYLTQISWPRKSPDEAGVNTLFSPRCPWEEKEYSLERMREKKVGVEIWATVDQWLIWLDLN